MMACLYVDAGGKGLVEREALMMQKRGNCRSPVLEPRLRA